MPKKCIASLFLILLSTLFLFSVPILAEQTITYNVYRNELFNIIAPDELEPIEQINRENVKHFIWKGKQTASDLTVTVMRNSQLIDVNNLKEYCEHLVNTLPENTRLVDYASIVLDEKTSCSFFTDTESIVTDENTQEEELHHIRRMVRVITFDQNLFYIVDYSNVLPDFFDDEEMFMKIANSFEVTNQ